jgi:nicotinate-nucleotide adenylyltransferase
MHDRSVGIMGGTFDPIHYGHLVIAEAARAKFQMEEIVFVPSGTPPHKRGRNITHFEHRFQMTKLAIQDNAHFCVSRLEIDRPGPSYAVDTIRALRDLFSPNTRLYFITGADAILEILSWKDVGALIGMCQLVAATRPGYSLDGLKDIVNRIQSEHKREFNVHTMEVPALMISSTDIRKRVESGMPIKYLLPDSVEKYIYDHKLYRFEHVLSVQAKSGGCAADTVSDSYPKVR